MYDSAHGRSVTDCVLHISSKVNKPSAASCQQTLPVMLNNKRAVDESVARAFCSAGIPFAVANNPHVKQAFMDVAMPSEFMLQSINQSLYLYFVLLYLPLRSTG